LPPDKRAAYVDDACRGDESLREAVESLLKSHEQTNNFIDAPAYQAAAEMLASDVDFKPGQQMAHYRIVSLIGEGGMGRVYLAEDTKLQRRVALKFLSRTLTEDHDRLRRFEREAQAASSLNHPNILTIHEISEAEGYQFIATEFIEGRTLRERLRSGVDLDETVEIAIQITSALIAAHRVEIVHRDIKPENIMIRREDGLVKVLDFGLAKMSEPPAGAGGFNADNEAPSQFKTNPGVLMGTVAYMSPEQARGDEIDERTDIWSLGVVLYELLGGRPPFETPIASEVIKLILEQDPPPLTQYTREIPRELERIVSKALIKNREDRYQTSKELLTDLHGLRQQLIISAQLQTPASQQSSETVTGGTVGSHAVVSMQEVGRRTDAKDVALIRIESLVSKMVGHKSAVLIAVGVVVVFTAALSFGWYEFARSSRVDRKSAVPFQTMKIKRFTNDGKATFAAISPDGKNLIHVLDDGVQQSLWLRQVTTYSNDRQILPPANVRYGGLTFSPDGENIYYVAAENNGDATLYQMPAAGGASKKLLTDIDTPVTFSPDGRRIAFHRGYPEQGFDALMVANADGTGERKLTTRKNDFWWPAWSPDGRIIATRASSPGANKYRTVVAVQVDDGTVRPISDKRWAQIVEMLWLRDGSGLVMTASEQESDPLQIWYLSYPDGETHKVTNDLNDYASLGLTADSTGLLAVQSAASSNIWIVPHGETGRAVQITFTKVDGFKGMSWTPDNHLVYESRASGNSDLWIADALGSNPKQLTADSPYKADPVVSPDGKHIVFHSSRTGHNNIWRIDIDGSNLKQLTDGPREQLADISPDGQWVVYTSALTTSTLWKVPLDGGNPVQVTDKPAFMPTLSPDGKLIACNYFENGRAKIAVIPFDGGQPIKTFESFTHPDWMPFHWTPDGQALAYIDRGVLSSIWTVPVFSDGPPKLLLDFKSGRIFDFAWSHDGSQLAVARGEVTNDVVLISNFVSRH